MAKERGKLRHKRIGIEETIAAGMKPPSDDSCV